MEQDSVDVLIVHFLRAFFEDSFDCVMIVLSKGHRTLLHESASILHLPHCLPRAPLRIYSVSIRVRGKMPNVSDGVALSSLVSWPLKTPHGQGRCWNFFSESIYLGCSKKWYRWPFNLPSLGCLNSVAVMWVMWEARDLETFVCVLPSVSCWELSPGSWGDHRDLTWHEPSLTFPGIFWRGQTRDAMSGWAALTPVGEGQSASETSSPKQFCFQVNVLCHTI